MSPFKRLIPLAIGLSLVLVTLSAAPAALAQTSTVSLELQAGALTASLVNLTLAPLTYGHTDQQRIGSLTLTVNDSSGTGDGWNVTVVSSDFVYTGTNGGTDIPAVNFAITAVDTPVLTVGQAVDATDGPRVGAVGTLDQSRKVIYANEAFGQGTYTQNIDTDLLVPGLARAGTYTGTITITVVAGPGA